MARMAGEALRSFNDYLADYDLTARGAGSDRGTSRFSGLDVNHVFQNRGEGVSRRDGARAVLDYFDRIKDTTKHGSSTRRALDTLQGFADEPDPNPNPEPNPSPNPNTDDRNSRSGGSEAGDNSISSPISQRNRIGIDGNNNRVNQDNSIRQTVDNRVDNSRDNRDYSRRSYGGSSRTFNYNGGRGESSLYDSPTSRATMGGYYDTDDSPAAANRFMSMYTDSAIRGQRDLRRQFERNRTTDNSPTNPSRIRGLNNELEEGIQRSRNRSNTLRRNMYGDSGAFNFEYTPPEPPEEITSNAEEIYREAREEMD